MSNEPRSFILKIQNDKIERQLFNMYTFYVGINRDWSHGSAVLFVRKGAFMGSGTIDKAIALEDLQDLEKKLCIENNWSSKILFSKLARFVPPVPIQDTPAAGVNLLALHGFSMSFTRVLQIERIARAKIIL